MLPFEIVDRVFQIAVGNATATAFSLDVGERQYLVTAKHVAESISGPATVKIRHGEAWSEIPVDLVGHSDVDVSVLCAAVQLTDREMKIDAAPGGFFAAQDVYFAGFPLGIEGVNLASPFPAPLVKKATISGAAGNGYKHPFYLDGHNNRGFSGGPVYLKIQGKEQFVISMVVSSFIYSCEAVHDDKAHPTGLHVQQNSGIMQAYSIRNALELIDANPIGFQL